MAYGSISHLPRFDNYHEALEYFNETKPVRGWTNVPLKSDRRQHHTYNLRKNGDNIECHLYRTPVLTYTPDQIIVHTWDSQTTCKFIDSIAPYWLNACIRQGQMRLLVSGHGEFIGGKIVIDVDEKYQPKPLGVSGETLEQIVLNKTRAAEARKGCKELIALAVTTSKLDGYWVALKNGGQPEDELMSQLQYLLRMGSYYVGAYQHFGFGTCKDSQVELIPALKQKVYTLAYATQECYDYIPAPYGVVPAKRRSV